MAIFQQTLLFLHGFTAVDPTFVRPAVGVSVVETPQMTHLAQTLHEKQNASDNDGTENENSHNTHDKNTKPGDGHVSLLLRNEKNVPPPHFSRYKQGARKAKARKAQGRKDAE